MRALMKHKKKGQMDEKEAHAKMGVLKDISDMANNDLGHDIQGLRKVSVMSTDDAGMQEGLKKAQEFVAHKQGHSHSDDDANRVSDDMHPESQRHDLDHESETTEQEDGMADAHGDLKRKGEKAMEGYAKGGTIHPGQYGEDQADVVGTPHQMLQKHGMNSQYARPTISKEWDPAKNYASGGEVEHQHDQTEDFMENGPAEIAKEWGPGKNYADGGMVKNKWGDPRTTDPSEPTDVERQPELQAHGMDTKAAQPTIDKERDMKKVSAHQHSVADAMQKGTHGTHGPVDPADEYADLEPDELEALIAHLQKHRKSRSSS